jgi:hypothetical protein
VYALLDARSGGEAVQHQSRVSSARLRMPVGALAEQRAMIACISSVVSTSAG